MAACGPIRIETPIEFETVCEATVPIRLCTRWNDLHKEAKPAHTIRLLIIDEGRVRKGGLDRHLSGLSGSSPRSVLIKICANKKIGEERRGDYPEAGINLEYKGRPT